MQRKRFSEDQIIGILREQEARAKAAAMLDNAALKGVGVQNPIGGDRGG
jgi:hypothetical protein